MPFVALAACGAPTDSADAPTLRLAAGAAAVQVGVDAYDVTALDAGEVLLLQRDETVGLAQIQPGAPVRISTDEPWERTTYEVVTTDLRDVVLGDPAFGDSPVADVDLTSRAVSEIDVECSSVGNGWDYCANDNGWCLSQGPSAGYCYICGEWGSDDVEVGHAC